MESVSPYTLRDIGVKDYAFVYRIHCETLDRYMEEQGPYGGEELKGILFAERLYPDKLKIIVKDGEDIGILSVDEREKELVVDRVAVTKSHQGNGIGRQVIQAVIERARSDGKAVLLSVIKTEDNRELPFRSLGFVPYAEDQHYTFMRVE